MIWTHICWVVPARKETLLNYWVWFCKGLEDRVRTNVWICWIFSGPWSLDNGKKQIQCCRRIAKGKSKGAYMSFCSFHSGLLPVGQAQMWIIKILNCPKMSDCLSRGGPRSIQCDIEKTKTSPFSGIDIFSVTIILDWKVTQTTRFISINSYQTVSLSLINVLFRCKFICLNWAYWLLIHIH